MYTFQFRSPKLVFKQGCWKDIPNLCKRYGENGLLISGSSFKRNQDIYSELEAIFEQNDMNVQKVVRKGSEPTTNEVDGLVGVTKSGSFNWILGIGGGSTLDLSKAVAGLTCNPHPASYYQEGHEVELKGLPFIAVPTTAGTGSEITNNSVLIDQDKGIKKSIRGDNMIAKIALLDPTLTSTMPPEITAHTGMDALTQAIESYVSKASNVLSDYFAERAIKELLGFLPMAWAQGTDRKAREHVLFGSLMSALSFSNAKLGAVHGFAHPIGVQFNFPHGLICGVLLPHVMKYNLKGNLDTVINKFAWIGRTVLEIEGEKPKKDARELANLAIDKIFDLLDTLELPMSLGEMGIKSREIPNIVADTKGSSLANNPRETNKELLTEILKNAL